MSTWKKASGRKGGDDGYQFGDATSWLINQIVKPPKKDDKDAKKKAALKKVEEVKLREQRKKEASENSDHAMNFFKQLVSDFLTKGSITEDQLDQLWVIARDIPAEKSATLFAELLKEQSTSSNLEHGTEDPATVTDFARAIETIMSGGGISPEQLTDISAKAKHLSSSTLIKVLQEGLVKHWEKREAAKKAKQDELKLLEASFAFGIAKITEKNAITAQELQLLCDISVMLSASTVNTILSQHSQSWEKLTLLKQEGIRKADEAAVALMNSRPERPFRPPPPPVDPVSGARIPPPRPPPPPPRVSSLPPPPPAGAAPTAPVIGSPATVTAATSLKLDSSASSAAISSSTEPPVKRPSFLLEINSNVRNSLTKTDFSDFLTSGGLPRNKSMEDANSLSGILKNSLAAMRDKIKAAEELGDEDYDDDEEWNHD